MYNLYAYIMCAPNARAKKEKPLYLFGIFGVGKSLHFCAVFTGVNCCYSAAPIAQGWSAAAPRFIPWLRLCAAAWIVWPCGGVAQAN